MNRWIFTISFIMVTSIVTGCVAIAQTPSTPIPTETAPPTAAPNSPTSEPTALPPATPASQPTRTVTIPQFNNPTTPAPIGTPVSPDSTQVKLIADAKADLVTRANVSSDSITVASVEPVEWADGSMGCPKPGFMYAQMVTPGYKIVLVAGGKQYEYHASNFGVVYCEPH